MKQNTINLPDFSDAYQEQHSTSPRDAGGGKDI